MKEKMQKVKLKPEFSKIKMPEARKTEYATRHGEAHEKKSWASSRKTFFKTCAPSRKTFSSFAGDGGGKRRIPLLMTALFLLTAAASPASSQGRNTHRSEGYESLLVTKGSASEFQDGRVTCKFSKHSVCNRPP